MNREEFCRWCRENASPTGIDWCGQFLEVDGELLHYVEAGSGEPLVLLHGFMEWSYTWRTVMEPLAAHARVLALDLRGFGLSGRDRRLKMPVRPDLWRQLLPAKTWGWRQGNENMRPGSPVGY